MNEAKNLKTQHLGKRLISLVLTVMLVVSLCASGLSTANAVSTDAAATGDTQYVYKLVDEITAGNEYLIVNKNEAGSAYALKNSGGSADGASMSRSSVTVSSADLNEDGVTDYYITEPDADIVWKTTANGEGFDLTNGTDYLEGKSGNVKIYSEQQYPERYWTYNSKQLRHTGGSNTYTVYYSSSSFTQSTSTSTSSSRQLYVYEKMAVDEIPVVIPTEAPTVAPITGDYVFKLTDSIKAGGEYLIVNKDEAGSAYALTNNGGSSDGTSLARTSVTVSSADLNGDSVVDTYIAAATTDLVWAAATNEEGYSLTNGTDYLEGKSGNIKIFDSQQYPERYWTYEDSQLRFVGSSTTYTLYYSNSSFTQSTSTSSSSSRQLYVYEKTAVDNIPTEVPTEAPTVAPITGDYVFKLTDSIKAGGEYLIVNKNEAGSAYALTNNGGSSDGTSLARTSVTISSADLNGDSVADTYIAAATSDLVWAAAANGEGYSLTNGADYLEGKGGNIKIYDTQQYSERYWTYDDSQLRFVGGSTTYTLYYSNSSFTQSTSTSSSSSRQLYVYEKTAADNIPTEVVTEAPTAAPITGDYVFLLVDSVKAGGEYLIVNTKSTGSAYAMKNNGGSSDGTSMASASVTVSSADINKDGTADTYIASATTDVVWSAQANGSGFNLTNGADYLEGKSGNVKIFSEQQYAERYWTYSGQQLQHNGGNNTYTVYYSSGSFTSSYNSSSEKVYLFEKTAADGSQIPTQAPTQKPTQRPTSAGGSGDVVNVGFSSDIHDKTSELRNWITNVQSIYDPDLDAMAYCGDYSYNFNKTGHVNTFNEIVSLTNELVGEGNGFYTAGNHEYLNASGIIEAIQDTPGFKIFGELRKTDKYIIFAMGAESSSDKYTSEDIAALDEYLSTAPTDIPIFIITHYPLHHYSSRTTTNAGDVIDVLNQYPNAVFLWGHNHTMSDTNYGVVKTAGDSIEYSSGKTKQINFTYLAAGGMYSESQTKYSGLVASIEGSNVTFKYYQQSTGKQIGSTVTASMIGEPVIRPTDGPTEPPTQGPTVAPVTGDFVFKLTDSIKGNGEYLIVNKNEAGSAYSLTNNGGSSDGTSLARTSVTISSSDLNGDGVKETYITSGTTNTVWKATGNGEGYTLTNGSDYLEGKGGNVKVYNSQQYPERYWTYSGSQLKFVGGSSTYTLYYSNSNFTSSTSSSSSSSRTIYIFEKTGVDNIPTEAPTEAPTEGPTLEPGTYVNLGFASDVHGNTSGLRTWLTNVQNAVDPDLEHMTYCGDYSYETRSLTNYVADFNEVVSITDEIVGEGKGIYTSGNHEYYINGEIPLNSAFTDTPGFTRIGEAASEDNYRIYCLGAAGWFSAEGEYPTEDIAALKEYLDSAPTDIPIFVAAHFPLHYFSSRTITNASKVIDVLNEHSNVVFLWAHNHSQSDPHYGQILKAGSSIEYASGKSKQINFTYANAGCIYQESQTKYSGLVASVSNNGDTVLFRYYQTSTGQQIGDSTMVDFDGITPVTYILGDVDQDGEATPVDAAFIMRYVVRVGTPITEKVMKRCGDVDSSDDITVVDATFIQRYSSSVDIPYPIGQPIQ